MSTIDRTDTPSDLKGREENPTIPLCVPEIRGHEWSYVKECLDTNWVSSAGAFVDRFEKMVGDYAGTEYAVAMVNGTAALHLALMVSGVQPEDEVLVSSLTFIAPANAIRYVGAWPVFIDAEPVHYQMDPERVKSFIEQGCTWRNCGLYNRSTGRRVRAILPVHVLGHPVDIDPIAELAEKFDLAVIEDASESLGAKYRGRPVGSLGDVACFSFNGNKIITTGGGGMLVTHRKEWADRARSLSTQAKKDPVEYIHREIGYNYRLTNIQAAMGCAQIECLREFIEAKRRIRVTYEKGLAALAGLRLVPAADWADATFWMSTLQIDHRACGFDSRQLMRHLTKEGIQTRPLWQPIHLSPAHQPSSDHCPIAEFLNKTSLSLPSSVGLGKQDQDRVIRSIRAFASASR